MQLTNEQAAKVLHNAQLILLDIQKNTQAMGNLEAASDLGTIVNGIAIVKKRLLEYGKISTQVSPQSLQ